MTTPPFSIHYDLRVSSVAGHLIDVDLTLQPPSKKGHKLTLPAWIPGSYMIRDFAKHIITLVARTANGEKVAVNKIDKQTWQLPPSDGAIIVSYQIYAYDLSVRGAYINDQYAFFNGSNVFLQVQGHTSQACSVTLEHCDYPELESTNIATTLRLLTSNEIAKLNSTGLEKSSYYADDYAELIDHPVLIGKFDSQLFSVDGVDFSLVFAGGHQSDMARITADLSHICQQHLTLFGKPAPIQQYLFITLLTDAAFGGLEHRASTALMFARNDLADETEPSVPTEAYRSFLSLCSHEFFHTWHVKRIRPIELVEGGLATEVYSKQLWIYEGITSYYDDLLLQRSKVIPVEDYLLVVGQNLTRLQRNKGRLKQSVAASSFDAWTKFYKQDESAINHIVSYYNKGAVLAMCLDLLIRLKSKHQYSLDNVMHVLWEQFGRCGTPTPEHVIHDILAKQLGLNLSEFLAKAVYGTDELPVESLLAEFGVGLHYRTRVDNNDKGGMPSTKGIKHDFGAAYKIKELGVEITQVVEHSSAYEAGVVVGDTIIAVDSWQVSGSNLSTLIDRLAPQKPCTLSLLRDKRFLQFSLITRPAPLDTVYLSIDDSEKLKTWLG